MSIGAYFSISVSLCCSVTSRQTQYYTTTSTVPYILDYKMVELSEEIL